MKRYSLGMRQLWGPNPATRTPRFLSKAHELSGVAAAVARLLLTPTAACGSSLADTCKTPSSARCPPDMVPGALRSPVWHSSLSPVWDPMNQTRRLSYRSPTRQRQRCLAAGGAWVPAGGIPCWNTSCPHMQPPIMFLMWFDTPGTPPPCVVNVGMHQLFWNLETRTLLEKNKGFAVSVRCSNSSTRQK